MLGKPKVTTRDERIADVCAELLLAVKVSDDEIAAMSGSSDMYEGLRLRIADIGARTGRRTPGQTSGLTTGYERWLNLYTTFVERPRSLALATAAAILLLLAVSVVVLLPAAPSIEQVAQRSAETIAPAEQPHTQIATQTDNPSPVHPVSYHPPRATRRHARAASRAGEVATDFLPLTFVDDSRAQESGHVVRVKVPRSALIAFGVPMNMDRAGELITADVVVGDDGLARAIRFVQ
jgi:hypothetical protein